jgi:hypothetical protein
LQGLEETRLVADDVIGREKRRARRPGFSRSIRKAAKPAGRGGVAGHRLLHDLRGGQAGQLVGNLVGQVLIGDDPGLFERSERFETLHGLLNHGALAVERQDLLGAGAPGTGPEAGAAAPGQYHGTEIDSVQH